MSVGNWNYNYGIFSNVRVALAQAAGIDYPPTAAECTPNALMGFWHPGDDLDDDILFLLLHQDCEGIFMPYTSERVARRMRVLLSESDAFTPVVRRQAAELATVLEEASEGYVVEFA